MDPEQAEVKAAGGVVRRDDGTIAIVHRPRYDDWSLPKGKLDPGETLGGVRAARGLGRDRAALRTRAGALADVLQRPQGAGEGRALLADGAGRRRGVRARRRDRRAALGRSLRRRRPPHLFPRRRTGAGRCCEPRPLLRPPRRLGAARRRRRQPGRRQRDRGDGRLDAVGQHGQPRRRLQARPRDRRAGPQHARGVRDAARRRAERDLLRPELHGDDDALRGDRRARAGSRATRSSARGSITTPTCARG